MEKGGGGDFRARGMPRACPISSRNRVFPQSEGLPVKWPLQSVSLQSLRPTSPLTAQPAPGIQYRNTASLTTVRRRITLASNRGRWCSSRPPLPEWGLVMLPTARIFVRLLTAAIFDRKSDVAGRSRGVWFDVVFLAGFAFFETFNAICFLLDAILFPLYRNALVREPIFIIGTPRSGKTTLQRMMTLDEQQFLFFRTWEILFPSVLQKKVLSGVGRLDRVLGAPLRTLIQRHEAARLEKYRHLDNVGLFYPEEDDKLLAHILASAELAFLFPGAGLENIARLDVAVDRRDRQWITRFYRQCVRRHAYYRGGRGRLLAQSPVFSGWVESLLDCFPDSRFVYVVRNPLDVVPAFVALARRIIKASGGREPGTSLDERLYELTKFFYTHPLQRLSSLPEDRLAIVKFEDLVRDAKQVVGRIYDQFGLELTPEYAERLAQAVAEARRPKSDPCDAPATCSIAPERIRCELQGVFDRFKFDAGETPQCPRPGDLAE